MNKLIIRHGERVTEHPIDDHPLVVGRDPQCDLFFADKKLSRRHARFERDGDGIRLVDLGSRNGCWVNEERVEKKLLTPSDAVRLGSLSVTLEAEPEPAERDDQESTVYLSAEPPSDDSGTMALSSKDLPDAEPPGDEGTVILPPPDTPDTNAPAQDSMTRRVEVGHEDPTLRNSDTVAREAREGSSEQTIMLQGNAPRAATDTGTVIFRGKTAPAMDDATRLAPAGGAAETKMQASGAPRLPEASPDTSVQPGEQSWDFEPPVRAARPLQASTLRFVGLVVATAALAFVVLAMPLLRTLGSALAAESSLRGRALVDLLAATNEEALRENRPETLSTERVAGEPGVVGAYILDPMGRVLAPAEKSGESSGPLLSNLGFDVEAKDIRAFRKSRAGDDTTVYALPVRAQGRRLGVAVLHYRVGAAVSRWTVVMLVLGSLLLLMGVAAAVLVARRWTLLPVQELKDDVEALRRGFGESLAEDRPYSDLATIARNFNELVQQRDGVTEGGTSGSGSATFEPMLDPTLVPEEHEQADR